MADSTSLTHNRNGSALFSKALHLIGKGRNNTSAIKRRTWVCTGENPAVDAGSQGTYPVAKGDFVLRSDNNTVRVCTVAPAAATAATFVQIA